MNYQIAAAPPDAAELGSPLIYSAAQEMFEYMFSRGGRKASDFLEYAYADGAGFFGYRNHQAVFFEGAMVGIGAFYSGAEYNTLSNQTVWQVFKYFPLRTHAGILMDFMSVKRWMPPPPRRMQYVANLGVAPEMRNRGVGSALLRHQKDVAKAKGKKIYALDVASNNPRAEALYAREGFVVRSESTFTGKDRGISIPAGRRMEQTL